MRRRSTSIRAVAAVMLAAVVIGACAPDPPSAIVGLSIQACDTGLESGSGAFVAPGIVLTAAHVVAGAKTLTVEQPGSGRPMIGEIVGFDPINDLAYVGVDDRYAQHLAVATTSAASGDTGTAYVVRKGAVVALPIEIVRPVNIRTEDIYVDTMTNRPGFELLADIDAGDSGGVVVVGGRVVGVIWARSNLAPDRAYAMDFLAGSGIIDEQLATGVIGDNAAGTPIDVARCY
jgi:S1-C subfamily serine protease